MKIKFVISLLSVLVSFEAVAIQITLNNLPPEYRVYSMRGSNLTNLTYAGHFDDISFDIPNQYIVLNSNGKTNLKATLSKWRKNTPVADGNPRTKNGIGYFPFKDSNGNNRYIALEYILRRRPRTVHVSNDAAVRSSLRPVARPNPPLESSLRPVARNQERFDPSVLSREVETEEIEFNISGDDSGSNELASSLRPQARPANLEYATPGVLREDFPPRVADFADPVLDENGHEDRSIALSYANASWNEMSLVARAEYLDDKYGDLLNAHGVRNTYDPKTLVCKTYRESSFDPQVGNRVSSAAGLSQVIIGTASDTFSRGGFRSKVEGFTHIQSGREFYSKMAGSMLAQMELGIGVLEQKRKDKGLSRSSNNIHRILQGYYGNGSSAANEAYASEILDCVTCVQDFGYSNNCLEKSAGR